ncbi:tRNA (adenosine(37)-N6)-threonylcarbamoyltransferase complex ATPase subunit type 1 TsaE [Lentilitoribacter sp. EG35]|uniref:tRNA (adenosine(37)-N6)-threonylcarbamoyltransferase complex ATPase subunit type 1 TsaE n=1 Tax=Lentilitoribacter sp. EG35 TaxID=3234192 RepID=UPI00345F413F
MATSSQTLTIKLENLDATQRFAEDLALIVKKEDCICLTGDLGAGKTTLVRATIRAVADDLNLEVPSPTFTLVQQYDLRIPIGHIDLYRASDPDEIFEFGLDEILTNGAAFIEWPEIVEDELPKSRISFNITGLDSVRDIEISGPEDFMMRLDRTQKIRRFLDNNGYQTAHRAHLQGDASYRHYERISVDGLESLILMNSPKISGSPILRDGLTYYDLAHLAQDIIPFIRIANYLQSIGLRTPKLYETDLEEGFLLLEDLGDDKPVDIQNIPYTERYIAAIDVLAHLHGQDIPSILTDDAMEPYSIPKYDADVMELEISLLVDWYWEFKTGSIIEPQQSDVYFQIWRELIHRMKSAETSLVLRDYHSPNIIWQSGESGLAQVGLIDFQDAQIGPAAYDVASLAQDARVVVSEELETQLLDRYKSLRLDQRHNFDPVQFDEAYKIMAAQRACKILGIFVRMNKRDGKSEYLTLIPQIERYLIRTMAHSVLKPLQKWFDEADLFRR